MSPLIQAVRKVLDISTEGIFYEAHWYAHEDKKSRLPQGEIQRQFVRYIKEDKDGDKLPEVVADWCLDVLAKRVFATNADKQEAGLSLK